MLEPFGANIDAPNLSSAALVLNTGPWLQVVERFGSSADSIAELRDQTEAIRETADAIAVKTLELRIEDAPGAGGRNCRRVDAGATPTDISLPPGGAILRPSRDSEVSLRRWASNFAAGLRDAQAGQPVRLHIPTDPSGVPWQLRLEQGGTVEVCHLGHRSPTRS